VILFVSVIGGREIGNFYSSFREVSNLKVFFDVEEEELSRYLRDTLDGVETDLEIGFSVSSPLADNTEDIVTTTPDYIKRWIIGVTVSPITVNQPEASDVEFEMLVEDQTVDNDTYKYPKEKISYIGLRDRSIQIEIDDTELLRQIVLEASETYAGEVKVEFRGRVHVHLLFLDTWLPFRVTRHTLVSIPSLEYIDSEWTSLSGGGIETLDVGSNGYVQLEVRNPTRIHSLQEEMTCEFFKDGSDEPVASLSKEVSMPPANTGQYVFPFRFTEPGIYRYRIISGDRTLIETSETRTLIVE
jgi:hypothetical protein